jgi:PKHD-type hydroxylase
MTLGFDPESRVWPIFMGQHKEDRVGVPVDIDVGDLVMYHGEELPHWRNAYKGKWQAQVFFHYVDADGENAEHAGDNARKSAEKQPFIDSRPFNATKSIIHGGVMLRNCDDTFPGLSTFHSKNNPEMCFTPEECDRIIALSDKLYEIKGTTGTGENEGTYNEEVRSVDVYDLPLEDDTRWIFDKLATAAGKANKEYYKYDLLGITHSLQLLHYRAGGHYDWHIDAGDGSASTRKLTVLTPLSKRTDFEGGGLKAMNNATEMDVIMERGSISTFPSYMPHKVEPVESGERWTLVSWIHGPDRFR